jgi:predicted DNA-binding protein
MAQKRKMTSVYLDAAALQALQELSKDSRVPIAVYLREAVDMVLAKYKVKVRTAAAAAKHK